VKRLIALFLLSLGLGLGGLYLATREALFSPATYAPTELSTGLLALAVVMLLALWGAPVVKLMVLARAHAVAPLRASERGGEPAVVRHHQGGGERVQAPRRLLGEAVEHGVLRRARQPGHGVGGALAEAHQPRALQQGAPAGLVARVERLEAELGHHVADGGREAPRVA